MKREQTPDEAAPCPRFARWPWWVALLACLAGLWLSIVLEQIHFKIHTDPAFHSFCAIDRKVNCDLVSRSPYAVFFGVPLAAWGIFAYVLAAAVSLWGLRSRWPRLAVACGLALGLLYVAASVVLGAVSTFLVTAICTLCLATYGINLLFLVCMLLAARPVGLSAALAELPRAPRARPLRVLLVLGIVGAGMLALVAAHPAYWKSAATAGRSKPSAPSLPHGVEPGGGHYLGAERPLVTLVEFSDYECPYCRQAHFGLRSLLERFPTRLRLVHRHYPLDPSCNPSLEVRMHDNACFAAAVAECAGRQERFWPANDYLYAEARSLHARSTHEIARDIGLDAAALEECLRGEGPRSVARDMDEGERLQLQGTPSLVVDGKVYLGSLPPWVLTRLEGAAGIDAGP
ncbi:MAG: thioredoxin domain-containing protein [Deltaproteobacteria bacterium]|nr:thioredoxin domain-containing protein [Deltaproteobacteria bacterium]